MGAVGSDYSFVEGSEFQLNQLFGYQDAEEGRANGIRLRDGIRQQHAWIPETAKDPAGWTHDWPVGTHVGPIGYQADPSQTQFHGDGAGIINIGSNGGIKDLSQSFDSPGNWLNATDLPLGDSVASFYVNYLASWFSSTGIPSGNWYGHCGTSLVYVGLNHNHLVGIWPTTIGNQPTSPVVWLSGNFSLHLHFMLMVWIQSGASWGGVDQLLVRPQLLAQDGTTYTYPADDLVITTGGNAPDITKKWFWHCHQVLNVASFPAGFASIGWQIQGDWANLPHAVSIFCMSRGQIAKINAWGLTQNAALLNKSQLGYGCTTSPNGYGGFNYYAAGPNSFNMFPIYAT